MLIYRGQRRNCFITQSLTYLQMTDEFIFGKRGWAMSPMIICFKVLLLLVHHTCIFGRIALVLPVYRLAMSVCLSVNILVKVSGWGKISALERVTNLKLCLKVTSNKFYWFLWLLWPWPWFVDFQGQIADNQALPSSTVSCFKCMYSKSSAAELLHVGKG